MDLSLSFKGGVKAPQQKQYSNGKSKGSNPPPLGINTEIKTPYFSLERDVQEILGEALEYNKRDRSLVLEFQSIPDAIRALNILPFGLNYKLYLLDA